LNYIYAKIDKMLQGILHAHSGFRWIALILLVLAIVAVFAGKTNKKISFYTLLAFHLQLILGLILFFISPKVEFSGNAMKDSVLRFFTVEHSFLMILSVILVTIGYSALKKEKTATYKWLWTAALVLLLIGIPWPFRGLGAGWF
jgi:Flp pilus assembly protein protease CpaA